MVIRATDLTQAAALAHQLASSLDREMVIAGALAMAAHGYSRETSDVDIIIEIRTPPALDEIENAAKLIGLSVIARHAFGGLAFKTPDGVRVDVIGLGGEAAPLTHDAIDEAVRSNRTVDLFGTQAYVVSLGYLIALKIVAERKKDIADIVELIKSRMEQNLWSKDRSEVQQVLRTHLGWYVASSMLNKFEKTAKEELGT